MTKYASIAIAIALAGCATDASPGIHVRPLDVEPDGVHLKGDVDSPEPGSVQAYLGGEAIGPAVPLIEGTFNLKLPQGTELATDVDVTVVVRHEGGREEETDAVMHLL